MEQRIVGEIYFVICVRIDAIRAHFFIFIYRILLDKDSCFFITGISILNTIVIFNFFDNSFNFSGLNFQLIYPVVFSIMLDKKYIYKLKNRFNV